ncbi:MAG: sulfotransferase [Cyanobacteriota bacterium]|nr:sulfotransferase [Cyanobacteriota bacterium]
MDESIPSWVRVPDGIAFSDVPVRPGGQLPKFAIVGAAKAGTTALNQYLSQHPQIFMCPLKEPHFFSTDIIYERGLDWYEGLYADASPNAICGEASTSYTRFPFTQLTPQRIHAVIPDIKLIYILREPVARVESECLQEWKYRRYVLNVDSLPYSCDRILDFLLAQSHTSGTDPIRTSEYINQIDEYLRFFRREQLLVLFQTDLIENPQDTLKKVYRFLDVDSEFIIETSVAKNVTANFTQGMKNEKLSTVLNKIPNYSAIKSWIPASIKNSIKGLLTSNMSQVFEPMSDGKRRELAQHFKPSNDRLADFLNYDLSDWNSSE